MLARLRVKFVCITMAIVTVMLGIVFALVYHFTNLSLEMDSLEMMQQITAKGPPKTSQDAVIPSVKRPYFILSIAEDGTITVLEYGNFDLSDGSYLKQLADAALSSKDKTGTLKEYGFRFAQMDPPKNDHEEGSKEDHKNNPYAPGMEGAPPEQDDNYKKDHPLKPLGLDGETVLVFFDTSGETAVLRNIIFSSLVIGTIILSVFFVVSMMLAKWMSKPVSAAMMQQKQFVADASHELKTPLTVILTNAELLQDPAQEHPEQRQCAKNIVIMTKQMRGLVDDLLDLAQVSEVSEKMPISALDMSTLVSDALLPFDPVFFEQGLLLESSICPDITVKGSEVHLKQLLETLLDNARKYSLPGTKVQVELTKSPHHCLLRVINQGDDISKEDLKNIFKRFYRIDKVRGMSQGYGLGLSIAQQIVEKHKGKIWAESSNGIITFNVQLPLH